MATSRRIYPYYGNERAPQFTNLNSGIDMIGNNPIGAGFDSLAKSLVSINQQEQADETKRQEKFQNLINVSLKDVSGRWQDEAVKKRDAFIKDAADIARSSAGELNWEQEKALRDKRSGIESFAGKSIEVRDWYAKAMDTMTKMKDPEARKATAENIKRIMSNTGGLEAVHEETLKPDWLAQPKYKFRSDFLDKITEVTDSKGEPDLLKIQEQVRAQRESQHPATLQFQEEYMSNNPNATPEEFDLFTAKQKMATMDSADNRAFKAREAATAARAKTPTPGIDKTTGKTIVFEDADGVTNYGNYNKGKGFALGTITDPESGLTYKNATLKSKFTDTDGVEKIRVTHDIHDQTKEEHYKAKKQFYIDREIIKNEKRKDKLSPEDVAKKGEDEYNKWVGLGTIKLSGVGKDQVLVETITVPAHIYKDQINQHFISEKGKAKPQETSSDSDRNEKKKKWASSKQ